MEAIMRHLEVHAASPFDTVCVPFAEQVLYRGRISDDKRDLLRRQFAACSQVPRCRYIRRYSRCSLLQPFLLACIINTWPACCRRTCSSDKTLCQAPW